METLPGPMPESMDSIKGGTNGAVDGFSIAALKRGYAQGDALPNADPYVEFPMLDKTTSGWKE